MKTIKERLFKKIIHEPNTGCWLWGGYLDRDGYGRIKVLYKQESSHRISYKLFKGEIPEDKFVCHVL